MKLQLNDDGTITVPLTPREGEPLRTVTLPEPTMAQLARIHSVIDQADEKAGDVPRISTNMSAQQLLDANEQMRKRTMYLYGEDAPYGNAFIDIVRDMTGAELTYEDLYGWVMNPKTLRQVLTHFQDPLPGPASESE